MDYSIFNTQTGDAKPFKSDKCKYTNFSNSLVSKDDLVAIKMRGLSYWVTHEEILEFFKEFKKNERSIIL